ncbi:MAG: hypothetical protein AAGF88_08070 [Pseudomonadota bacterium]
MFSIPAMAGLCAGAVSGILIAARRKGNRADMAQYGAVYGIIGFVLGVIVTIVLSGTG